MTVGENIRKYRKDANLTQKKLGELSGTSETTIKQYELGKRQPKLEMLYKISIALGIGIEKLIGIEVFDSGNEFQRSWNKLSEKAFSNNNDKLTIIHKVYTEEEQQIIKSLNMLNENGRKEAVKRVEELTEIQKYQK